MAECPVHGIGSTLPLEVTGVVLAGGASRRMGRDKAFLVVGGRPMIRWVLDALHPVCRDVLIVTKTPEAYSAFGARVIEDSDPAQAPLVGLCSGLRAAATAYVFVAACDLPFLSMAAVSWMCGQTSGVDAVVPRVDGRWHPLHAVYATAALPVFEARLRAGAWTLVSALEGLRVRSVGAAELGAVDPALRTIQNINTEAEYWAALARLAREG